jgi:hypothetical protein
VEIMEALQDTISIQGVSEPYILAVRLVESLRWMSYNVYQREFMPPEAVQRLRRLEKLLTGSSEEEEKEEKKEEKKGEPKIPGGKK